MKAILSLAAMVAAFAASIQTDFHWGGSAGLPAMSGEYSALVNGLLAMVATYFAPELWSWLKGWMPKRVPGVPVVASGGLTPEQDSKLDAVYQWVKENTARANIGKVVVP